MKKNVFLLLAGILLMCGTLKAQVGMPIPNGSFEQWTSHQGYSVQVLFLNLPIYGEYSTPTGWDYLAYPVNESLSQYGMAININTTIPVVLATPETGDVPDGTKAVKLQSLMLSDIVDPTALSLAGDMLDSSFTQMVIPSILSTGAIKIDSLMPLMTGLMADTGDLLSLLPTLLTRDVNDFVSGGLPLDGFKPASLTGSYKYHSAVGGDNGAVVLLGTRYNTATQQRDIVGFGINLELTDTAAYTPFEVEYMPLSTLLPGTPRLAPDTLIVAIVSSASNNMQQGSYLCVDNLQLWPAPDTCAAIGNLMVRSTTYDAFPEMQLMWDQNSQPDHWEVSICLPGTEPFTGTVFETTEPYFEIHTLEENGTLEPNTLYDIYVRSVCDEDIYGEWDSVHYRTFCAGVNGLTVNSDNLQVAADKIEGYSISWDNDSETTSWTLTYGIYNEQMPDSWGTTITVDTPYFALPPLQPNRTYSVLIQAHCGEDNTGRPAWKSFTTTSLTGIETANQDLANSVVIYPNPAHGQCVVTVSETAELKLFDLDGRLLQTLGSDGSPVLLQLPAAGIYILQATTPMCVTTCKIVNN